MTIEEQLIYLSQKTSEQIAFLSKIDNNLKSNEQFNKIYSEFNWGEEKEQVDIFVKLLDSINIENHTPSIIELGSSGTDGSMYSILFEKKFNSNCIIINTEPRKCFIENVKKVWGDKHLINAKLYHGYSGEMKCYGCNNIDISDIPKLKIKNLFIENNINKLDIFHADIQGSEISVLKEIKQDGLLDSICYFFVSTHYGENKNTYYECIEFFNENLNAKYYYSDPYKGGFGDGLIVVENLNYKKQ